MLHDYITLVLVISFTMKIIGPAAAGPARSFPPPLNKYIVHHLRFDYGIQL